MDIKNFMPWAASGSGSGQSSGSDGNAPLRALQADINRAFESFWQSFPQARFHANVGMSMNSAGEPRVDIAEMEDHIEITADMPGFEDADIEVEVAEDALIIKGEKSGQRELNSRTYHMNERFTGSMRRIVPLPVAIDQDHVTAVIKNGVLTITLAKDQGTPKNVKRISVVKE